MANGKQTEVVKTKGLGGVIEAAGILVEDIIFFCQVMRYSETCVVVSLTPGEDKTLPDRYNLYTYCPANGLTFINKYKGDFQALRVAMAMCSQGEE